MKLNKEQKQELKVLQEMANDAGVKGIYNEYTGVTITWYRNFSHSNMVTVSASFFSPNDDGRIRVKTGKYLALSKLFNGESIQLPLGIYSDTLVSYKLAKLFEFN